jgi:hypothetical protein
VQIPRIFHPLLMKRLSTFFPWLVSGPLLSIPRCPYCIHPLSRGPRALSDAIASPTPLEVDQLAIAGHAVYIRRLQLCSSVDQRPTNERANGAMRSSLATQAENQVGCARERAFTSCQTARCRVAVCRLCIVRRRRAAGCRFSFLVGWLAVAGCGLLWPRGNRKKRRESRAVVPGVCPGWLPSHRSAIGHYGSVLCGQVACKAKLTRYWAKWALEQSGTPDLFLNRH